MSVRPKGAGHQRPKWTEWAAFPAASFAALTVTAYAVPKIDEPLDVLFAALLVWAAVQQRKN